MRPGLVVIGLVFAIVGGGLIVSFLFLSVNSPMDTQSNSVSVSSLGPNRTQIWLFPAVGTGSGVLTLSWSSTSATNVSFWKTTPCSPSPNVCPVPPALVAWAANSSGKWTGSGSIERAYLLEVGNVGARDLAFNGTLSESHAGLAPSFSTATWILVSIGSVLLLGTGAISLFLGLFLPGGVYRHTSDEIALEEETSDGNQDFRDRTPDDPRDGPQQKG